MTAHDGIGVSVPATSANLGPGFDAFGVALTMSLRARTAPREERRVVPSGDGAAELPTGDDNLVWRAFTTYCEHFGAAVPDVTLLVDNDIPLERGMGSSSAAAVAGIVLARAVTGAGGTHQDLVDLAAGFDGHPDNVAPAVLGGLVVCVAGKATRLQPSGRLRPVVCVPETRQNTHEARGVLPASVPLADAAANGARAALVLAGLAGAAAWDPAAMADVLHEPVRLEVMAASGALVRALRAAGIGACLSGAGPSVLAVVPRADAVGLERVRAEAGDGWRVLPLDWDLAGTRLLRRA
ncbi:MAG TPA: homoserine kinase [Egibacteraceae bacterium]|nr:homoserine kinase [Egibacteraceae bacterium]